MSKPEPDKHVLDLLWESVCFGLGACMVSSSLSLLPNLVDNHALTHVSYAKTFQFYTKFCEHLMKACVRFLLIKLCCTAMVSGWSSSGCHGFGFVKFRNVSPNENSLSKKVKRPIECYVDVIIPTFPCNQELTMSLTKPAFQEKTRHCGTTFQIFR